jgi:hypothetical protein
LEIASRFPLSHRPNNKTNPYHPNQNRTLRVLRKPDILTC